MRETSSHKKKKGGRPPKTTVPITLELTRQQDAWLNELVDGGCHGPDREAILATWIADRFRQLRDSSELRRSTSPSNETNIVQLDEAKNSKLSNKAEDQTDQTKIK